MLEVRNINKSYPGFKLSGISFTVEKGDYFVILGPSGAGKTQILEILAGLVEPDEGAVFLDGKEITDQRVQSRPMGLVFQDLAVFPHLSVSANIGYSLRHTGRRGKEREKLIHERAGQMEIEHLLRRSPSSLSGGELQRVALARTLIRDPLYLLLDEPLSSLDAGLRQGLRGLLKKINAEGRTIIHVTHDYEEALVLATRVLVIDQGKVIQSGTADEVFRHPGSEFVARFTGVRNFFPARLFREEDRQYGELETGQVIRLNTSEAEGKGMLLLRGEDIFISLENTPNSATNQLKGTVVDISPYPFGFEILVDTGTPFYARITRESLQSLSLRPGIQVWISFKAANVRFVKT